MMERTYGRLLVIAEMALRQFQADQQHYEFSDEQKLALAFRAGVDLEYADGKLRTAEPVAIQVDRELLHITVLRRQSAPAVLEDFAKNRKMR